MGKKPLMERDRRGGREFEKVGGVIILETRLKGLSLEEERI